MIGSLLCEGIFLLREFLRAIIIGRRVESVFVQLVQFYELNEKLKLFSENI